MGNGIEKMELEGLKQAMLSKKFEVNKLYSSDPGSEEWDAFITSNLGIKKFKVFQRDNCTCKSCGATGQYLVRGKNTGVRNTKGTAHIIATNLEILTIDHIIPHSVSKSSVIENLQTLCNKCNNQKANTINETEEIKEIDKVIMVKKQLHKPKNLLDELAISMPWETIPDLDPTTMLDVYKKLKIEVDLTNPVSVIEAQIKYQAIIRYKYAKEMLNQRS